MKNSYQVTGTNRKAPFTLKIHRGDGMVLLAMNWRKGKPPRDFVGFAIEYREPKSDRFWPVKNRIGFPGQRNEAHRSDDLEHQGADPEVSLGALSEQCGQGWRVSLPRHADVHG